MPWAFGRIISSSPGTQGAEHDDLAWLLFLNKAQTEENKKAVAKADRKLIPFILDHGRECWLSFRELILYIYIIYVKPILRRAKKIPKRPD